MKNNWNVVIFTLNKYMYLISWLDCQSMAGFCGLCRSLTPDPGATAQRKSASPLIWNTKERGLWIQSLCSHARSFYRSNMPCHQMKYQPCMACWLHSSVAFPLRLTSPQCRSLLWFSPALKETKRTLNDCGTLDLAADLNSCQWNKTLLTWFLRFKTIHWISMKCFTSVHVTGRRGRPCVG